MNVQTSSPTLDCSSPISPSDLREMDVANDVSAAQLITARVQFLDRQAKLSYAEIGMLAEYVEARRLYQCIDNPDTGVPCVTQNEWLAFSAPFGRSTWFAAKKTWKELADIPPEERVQMPRSNLLVMQRLSRAVRKDPAVIQAAKEMTEGQFREKIEAEHPLEHIEGQKGISLKPEKSQAQVIEEAIALAIRRGAQTREEAFEDIAQNYLDDFRDEEGAA